MIITINEFRKYKLYEGKEYDYMLLSRLQQDCEYFLKYGHGDITKLWAGNIEDQISKMKELWKSLDPKPEWLTYEEIIVYKQKMLAMVNEEHLGNSKNKVELVDALISQNTSLDNLNISDFDTNKDIKRKILKKGLNIKNINENNLPDNIRLGNHYKDKYLSDSFSYDKLTNFDYKGKKYKETYIISNLYNAPKFNGILNILDDGRAFIDIDYTTYGGGRNKTTNYFNNNGLEIISNNNSNKTEKKYFDSLVK